MKGANVKHNSNLNDYVKTKPNIPLSHHWGVSRIENH